MIYSIPLPPSPSSLRQQIKIQLLLVDAAYRINERRGVRQTQIKLTQDINMNIQLTLIIRHAHTTPRSRAHYSNAFDR